MNVRVTNTNSIPATLYGWIDYNANGVFDNATERTSVTVPNGTNNSIVTLVFPPVPSGFTGTTYARFRLSTDAAAANPTGVAADGEVEDYRATLFKPGGPTVDSTKTTRPSIASYGGLAAIGDLDGDGVTDLAAGFEKGGAGRIAVSFLNSNGTVKSKQEISSGTGGGPFLTNGDYFGSSLASLGDLDGDGVTDLLVGA